MFEIFVSIWSLYALAFLAAKIATTAAMIDEIEAATARIFSMAKSYTPASGLARVHWSKP